MYRGCILSLAKVVTIGAIAIFGVIGVAAVMKKGGKEGKKVAVQEIKESREQSVIATRPIYERSGAPTVPEPQPPPPPPMKPPPPPPPELPPSPPPAIIVPSTADDFPNIDRIHMLFSTGPIKLPIVETITYASSVPWIKGRPAWVADYASYYGTSRHFIARSLNGKEDYFTQKVSNGSRFNVFKKGRNINFYLLIDTSLRKMGFYYVDLDTQERVLLKTYKVSLGRLDSEKPSGCLTPLGKYSLGSKIAVYKPGVMGYFQDQTTEMIQIFGTRWIPFDQELEGATASAKGYGIHGAPWPVDPKTGQLVENRDCIGRYDGDGCVRLASEDMEEIFAIVITKPTFVVIVKDFHEAMLPGKEVASPTK